MNTTVSGTTITKTGGAGDAEDAGAASQQSIASGDAAFQFTVDEANRFRFVGFGHTSTWQGASNIEYSFRIQSGHADVYENNAYRTDILVAAGDVMKLEVVSGVAHYYKNGVLQYTSGQTPVYPLYVITSMIDASSTIAHAQISGGALGAVTWVNQVNTTVSGTTITKTGGQGDEEDAGAASQESIASGDATFEFTVDEVNNFRFVGFGHSSTWQGAANIDFSFRLQTGHADVYENANYVTDVLVSVGDVMKIQITDGVASYYKNDVLQYTSDLTPAYPLYVITSMIDAGSTIAQAQVTGGDGGGSGSGSGGGGSGPAPSHLEADAISTSEIDLGWDPPSGSIDGYKVYRDGSLIHTVAATTTTYQDTGLATNSAHTYKVVAYTGSTDSPDSNTDTATTHKADANSSGNGFGYTTNRLKTTFNSIGLEVDITGDANYTTNRTVATMVYRQHGTTRWHRAFAPLRIVYRGANQVNGSILYLASGTTYDLSIYLQDPDGGAKTITTTATTWADPVLPACTAYVAATGTPPGSGTLASPYVGFSTAQSHAAAGTVFCLRNGTYGTVSFTASGNSTQGYVVWRAYQSEQPTFSQAYVGANYLWLDGLYFRNPPADSDTKFIRQATGAFTDVRITHCNLSGADESIRLTDGTGARWYVADNTIVGTRTPNMTQWDGEGVDIQNTPNSVIAHNKITNAADAISQPGPDSDVFGNDISDCSDDGIETDDGGNNVRVWGNRIANVNNGFSFQYMHGAPWYFTRNQFINSKENPLKLQAEEVCSDEDNANGLCSPVNHTEVPTETVDRFVFVHNTIVDTVGSGYVQEHKGYLMLRGIMKNNLWVAADGSNGSARMWDLADYSTGNGVNWRTDVDYDGFDYGATSRTDAFHYTGGGSYSTLSALAAATGIESHGKNFVKESCFTSFNVPSAAPAAVPVQVLTLQSSCSAAVDQGLVLSNFSDGYQGTAPDLGAYEVGVATPTFGPR